MVEYPPPVVWVSKSSCSTPLNDKACSVSQMPSPIDPACIARML